jgi:predicted GIY-YIG superfamily endonuclease
MKRDNTFWYVYILHSGSHPDRFYSGFSTDIEKRLKCHNSGSVPATKPYHPWRIKTCIAFSDEIRARAFEQYLKTQSGRAFAKKRL